MTDVTGLVHRTSVQHVELGSTRCNRDVGDLNTILKWLAQHNPFDIQRPELRSLSSGLTASDGDGFNCDEVEEVVSLLQGKLDDVKYHEASIKRTEKVRTLIHLTKGIKIDQETVHVEPLILFSSRMQSFSKDAKTEHLTSSMSSLRSHHLCSNTVMRKPTKSVLGSSETSGVTTVITEIDTSYVLDGGALLHRVRGLAGNIYKVEHVASFSTAIQVDRH